MLSDACHLLNAIHWGLCEAVIIMALIRLIMP